MALHPGEIFNIDITIDTQGLETIVNNCSLAAGTFEEPIFADSFADVQDLIEIPLQQSFSRNVFDVKAIQFNLKEKVVGANPTLKLLCVNTIDVTKAHTIMPDPELINDIYDVTFDCANLTTQGRSLCIASTDNADCILEYNLNSDPESGSNFNFNTFTTIFTLEIPNGNGNTQTCCFSVDPVMSFRTRRRR